MIKVFMHVRANLSSFKDWKDEQSKLRQTIINIFFLVGKRVMVMEVPGKRRRGRPKRRWLDSIRNNYSEREFSLEEVQDRVK